jgi:DNA uptake protein ComE-like DNA-binding protein
MESDLLSNQNSCAVKQKQLTMLAVHRIFLVLAAIFLLHFWCSTAPCQEKYTERFSGSAPAEQSVPAEDRIDINHASIDELLKVPGLTKTWAGRIVRYRPYRSKQDLLDRGIVPEAVYERIRNDVIAHREKQ